MTRPEPPLKRQVRERADGRCEYCRVPQSLDELPHELEHVLSRQHGGGDDLANLAIACRPCNGAKGPNICSVDDASGEVVRLFDPRRQIWAEHFRRDGNKIVGVTPAGRATVRLLARNDGHRRRLRRLDPEPTAP